MSAIPTPGAITAALATRVAPETQAKAKAAAQDFEAVFLNTMLQQMVPATGESPFSGGHAAAMWRSLLTDEYAKAFARAGGIGIADQVYRTLIAAQAARPS